MDLLTSIRLGIRARDFFPYDGYAITLRPLTSIEMDICEETAYTVASEEVAKLIMRLRLGDIKLDKDLLSLTPSLYEDINKYWNMIDYAVVYHSMKDFMPNDFTIDDVTKMRDVHTIAKRVFTISSAPDDVIIDEVATEKGKRLAIIIYTLHQPLNDEAWKLTPIQHKFLVYAHPNSIKKVADSWEEFVKKRSDVEVLRHVSQ